jgi:sugar phosphate isomerase/epimerase
MKLGIAQLLPTDLAEIDDAAIRRAREMGFAGAAFFVFDPPQEIPMERAEEIGQMFVDEGVEIVEYGQYLTTLVHPNADVRRANIETLRDACRVARGFGCPAVITGAGSLHPSNQWAPHPDNRKPETIDRLIGSLREAVRGAEQAGVILALECHVVTPLYDVQTTRDVLDAVGSPALKVHLDPVNWMTFDTAYDSGPAIAEMFAILGPDRIYGAHSKGLVVEEHLITHLSETYTGAPDDLIDHATIVRELAKLPGDPYLVIEHLAVEQMPGARDRLLRIAAEMGMPVQGAPERIA